MVASNIACKRWTGTIALGDDAAPGDLRFGEPWTRLKFWVSYDNETDWDYAFVEVNEVGTDAWATLPDLNGLTTTSTGESCPAVGCGQ